MPKQIPIIVNISEETVNKIHEIAMYKNHVHYLNPSSNKRTDLNIEDFITGSINYQLDMIKNYKEIFEYEDLNQPFQLKNRFKELFKKEGLTQHEIERITGVKQSNISLYFKNRQQPSLDNFIKLWVALKCPPIHEVIYREEE